MARETIKKTLLSVFAMTLCFGQGTVRADDDIPTLSTVIAQATSVQTMYLMMAPMINMGLALEYEQIEAIGSEDEDCKKLKQMTFLLGCTVTGAQERETLRNKDSYAAGSSMYQLLDYYKRPDTGLFAASDLGSALNSFEYKWVNGGDIKDVSKDFFNTIMGICDSQFRHGAPQENVNACIRAAGQFLTEMANHISPQVRNTWVDQVLADTLQIRPTWSGVKFSFSYIGVSSSFGFDSIPSSIPSFKENLLKDWGCKGVREERQAAGCPIA